MVILLQLFAWLAAACGIGWAYVFFPLKLGQEDRVDQKVACLNENLERIDQDLPQLDCDAMVASMTPIFPDNYLASLLCLGLGLFFALALGGMGSMLQALRDIKKIAATNVEEAMAAVEAPVPPALAPTPKPEPEARLEPELAPEPEADEGRKEPRL